MPKATELEHYACNRCWHTAEVRPGGVSYHRRLANRVVSTLRLAGCRCPNCHTGRFVRLTETEPSLRAGQLSLA